MRVNIESMRCSKTVLRLGGALTVVSVAGCLLSCSSAPEKLDFVSPTMAPPQSISEACSISSAKVDELTLDAKQRIGDAMSTAASDVMSGKMPTIDVLSGSIGDTLKEVEGEINNAEVLDAVKGVHKALRGFHDIQQPDSAVGVPAYLRALGRQLGDLGQASGRLQSLCTTAQ